MTRLEEQIAEAMKKLLEEQEEIEPAYEEEVLIESVERRQKKGDSRINRESRRIFRRWRQKSGI